jgi:AcrR family transcriptional regulator
VAYRRTPRVAARLAAQRERIVASATGLLAEGGYSACTIARVAERAGVAAGSVYNHVGGKGELVGEVFRTVVGREVAAVRAAAAGAGSAAEQVSAVIETFAGRALKQPRLAFTLLAEPVDAEVDALRLRFRRAFADELAGAVARGVSAGELPPQNADVVAAALVGAIGEALVAPLAAQASSVTPPDALPTLITFALRAIGADHATHA